MSWTKARKLVTFSAVLVVLLLLEIAVPAFAGESRTGQHVVIGPNEVINGNVYLAGQTIIVDGTINGDVIAAGSEIRVNGTVNGEVIAGGQNIVINGNVKYDVRAASYNLEIAEKGAVGRDVTALGYNIHIRAGSSVGGDVYAAASQIQINGRVAGRVRTASNGLWINGQIAGDVVSQVAPPDAQFNQLQSLLRLSPIPVLAPGLHIGDSAIITGTVKYRSTGEASVSPGAQVKKLKQEAPPEAERARERERRARPGLGLAIALWILHQVRRLITLLVVAGLLIWLVPRLLSEAADTLRIRPWPSLGWGCVVEIIFLIAVPIMFVLLILIGLLIGIPAAGGLRTVFIIAGLLLESLAIIAFAIVTSYVTKIVIAYLFGALILTQVEVKYKHIFWPTLLGTILFIIVTAIPILGWLANLAALLFGLGALWLWFRDRYLPWRPVLVPAVPLPPGTGPAEPSTPAPPMTPPAETMPSPLTEPATPEETREMEESTPITGVGYPGYAIEPGRTEAEEPIAPQIAETPSTIQPSTSEEPFTAIDDPAQETSVEVSVESVTFSVEEQAPPVPEEGEGGKQLPEVPPEQAPPKETSQPPLPVAPEQETDESIDPSEANKGVPQTHRSRPKGEDE